MTRRFPARFLYENCLFGRATVPCTARQTRNGLLAVNMIVWALIVFAFSYLV